MSLGFYLLLMLTVGQCNNDHIFGTETVSVGENVTLTCLRQHSWLSTHLFWLRLVSGKFPEILGSTVSHNMELFGNDGKDRNTAKQEITAKQEPGTFVLHIPKAQISDTAVYYCIKVQRGKMKFLRGTYLRITGPEPGVTAVIQEPLAGPVYPGDSVSLQCSVLSSSKEKTCPEENKVYWFSARPHESHPNLIYHQENRADECEAGPEARSPQTCFYSFSKNVTSSDAGTVFCAVAACGEIMFGNGTKVEIEDIQMCDVHTTTTAVFVLSAALALSLIIIASLLYYINKKKSDTNNAVVSQETNASGFRQNQQIFEDSLVYSTTKFTRRKSGKSGRINPRSTEESTVYSGIRIC